MGNGPMRAWPPAAVVTVVHAGGRIEEYKRAMLVGELMHLHPRHNVVRPDFFRSSRAVVLEPQQVLMPGQRFFLVPFHIVRKRSQRRRLEVPDRSTPSSAESPRRHPPERNHCSASSICSSSCVVRCGGRKHFVGGSPIVRRLPARRTPQARRAPAVIRSPANRASSLSKSPTTVSLLLARKQLIHKERGLTRGSARRKPSTEHENYAERRTSLQSQMREHDQWPFEESVMQAGASTRRRLLKSADSAERRLLSKPPAVAAKLPAPPVTSPASESFHTPMSSPPAFGSPVGEFGWFEAMDSSESESTSELASSFELDSSSDSARPLLRTPPSDSGGCASRGCNCGQLSMGSSTDSILRCASIHLRMMKETSSRRPVGERGQREERSSDPILLMPPPGSDERAQLVVAHDHMMQDSPTYSPCTDNSSNPDHRTSEFHRSGLNETSRSSDSQDWKSIHDLLAAKVAAVHSRQALSRSGSTAQHNGWGQPMPSKNKQVGLRQILELEQSLNARCGAQQQSEQHPGEREGPASECVWLPEFNLCPRVAENSKIVVKELNNGRVKSSANPPAVEQNALVVVDQPERTAPVSQSSQSMPSIRQQKLRYRQKLIQHLCFSSRGLESPVHPLPAASSNIQERRPRVPKLKLIDHLKLDDISPVTRNRPIFKQPDSTKAATYVPQQRIVPWPRANQRDDVDSAGMDVLGFNESSAGRNQSDPSKVNNFGRTCQRKSFMAEDKFLKMPPLDFRRRRIKTRRRIQTITSWKPNLSPLVEFN